MELKFNQTCSGAVFVYSKGKRSAVSARGWTETEGRRLCQDLKCGNFKSKEQIDSVESFWNTSFSCKDVKDPKSIWDCEMPWVPSRGRQKQLFIECQGKHCFLLYLFVYLFIYNVNFLKANSPNNTLYRQQCLS